MPAGSASDSSWTWRIDHGIVWEAWEGGEQSDKVPSVRVAACCTKNGDEATLPIPNDLADDLAAYVATLPTGAPIFPLPVEKGAKMLRVDLEAAGIPYRDAAGLVFDFRLEYRGGDSNA